MVLCQARHFHYTPEPELTNNEIYFQRREADKSNDKGWDLIWGHIISSMVIKVRSPYSVLYGVWCLSSLLCVDLFMQARKAPVHCRVFAPPSSYNEKNVITCFILCVKKPYEHTILSPLPRTRLFKILETPFWAIKVLWPWSGAQQWPLGGWGA